MSQRQTVTMEERERAMGIVPGMVQCEGCPDESLRVVPQGGVHSDDCGNCFRHCWCQRPTMGEPAHEPESGRGW